MKKRLLRQLFLFGGNLIDEVVIVAKYEKWLKSDNLILLEGWARDGLTDEQIAHNMGVSVSTLYDWKKKYLKISESLKKGKVVVDYEVENALLNKALGITKIVKKPIKLKEVIYDNGKRVSEKEHVEYADEEVYIPPDTTAQIFWLKNRRPDKWRDKPQAETSDADARAADALNNIFGRFEGADEKTNRSR